MGWGGILGLEHGVVQAPMGPDISGPDLVAAVANAGGLGLLRGPDKGNVEALRKLIHRTRELTDKPFGVGILLCFPHDEGLQIVLEEKVGFLHVSWGDFPKDKVQQAHDASIKVVHQVGTVQEAIDAASAGVDAIIVQGIESGGHVASKTGLMTLLPAVVDAVREFHIPVIAAGGIVDSRGYVAALALGAAGVCLGTRFVATLESYAHPVYKKNLLNAKYSDTEYTDLYGRARWNAPTRVLRTAFHELWKDKLPAGESESEQPIIGHTTVHGQEQPVQRFSGKVPNPMTQGDIESMVMYAGTGVGQIKELLPAASVVKGLVEGAENIIKIRLAGLLEHSHGGSMGLKTMV